jgi:hypothetical protein
MANQGAASDKNKKIILAVLFLVMVVVLVYQIFLSEPAPRKRSQPGSTPGPTVATTQTPSPAPQVPARQSTRQAQDLYLQQLLSDTTPLQLAVITRQTGSSQVGSRGNIFAYYVPPPPPPQPPPKPPPIDLQSVQPSTAVAGTPKQFTLTVKGRGFPSDALIIIDGRARETKRISDTTLTTEVIPADYASPRNLNVEVKSKADPANFWSRGIPFVVQPAPEPQFKYVGRIGDQAVFELAGTREIVRMTRGSTVQGVWLIDSISDAGVDLTHTQYQIRKRVQMQGKGR